MRLGFVVILLTLTSCTTIIGRKLPLESTVGIETKKSIVIFSPHASYLLKDKEFEKYLIDLNIFSKVKVTPSYDFLDPNEKFDLILETKLSSNNFFEAYCVITLMIVPCTPPLNYTITNTITDVATHNTKSFELKENATKLTWLFGFLIPGAKNSDIAEEEFNKNIINHLVLKIKDADVF